MKRITVFFRYDDYSQLSSLSLDKRLIEAFQNANTVCTFAVIPAVTDGSFHDPSVRNNHPLEGDKLRVLHSAVTSGVVDVALHGLHHRSISNIRPYSEFLGLAIDKQRKKLQEGIRFLEEALATNIKVFVPPWNKYDCNTLKALAEIGITGVSANRWSPYLPGYAIRYLPTTAEVADLHAAIRIARASRDTDIIIGLLFHPYDFYESGDMRAKMSVEDIERDLAWLARQTDVQVKSVTNILETNESVNEKRYWANRANLLERIYPPGIDSTIKNPLYHSISCAIRKKFIRIAYTVFMYIAIAFAAFVLSNKLLLQGIETQLLEGIQGLAVRSLPFLAITAVVLRAVRKGAIYRRGMSILSVMTGAAAAMMV